MAWVKLDDHFPEHPKLLSLGRFLPLCGWLQICAISYCNRHLTDGRFPKEAVPGFLPLLEHLRFDRFDDPHGGTTTDVIYPSELADIMVTSTMWVDEGSHYRIHDYLNYQPSKEQITKERQVNRIRQGRFRNANSNAVTNALITTPPVPDPDPDPISDLKDRDHLIVLASTTSENGKKPRPLSQEEQDKASRYAAARAMDRPWQKENRRGVHRNR